MLELAGVTLGLGVAAMVALGIAAVLLFPLFWLWMLFDAALRDDADFPGDATSQKLVWIVLMVFFHLASIVYFFAVFRRQRRGTTAAVSHPTVVPPTPAAA